MPLGIVPNWRTKAGIITTRGTNEDINTVSEDTIGGLKDEDAAAERPFFEESTGGPERFLNKVRQNEVSNLLSLLRGFISLHPHLSSSRSSILVIHQAMSKPWKQHYPKKKPQSRRPTRGPQLHPHQRPPRRGLQRSNWPPLRLLRISALSSRSRARHPVLLQLRPAPKCLTLRVRAGKQHSCPQHTPSSARAPTRFKLSPRALTS